MSFTTWSYGAFGVMLTATVAFVLFGGNSSKRALSDNADFARFQRLYLLVYVLVMLADWVQGPYLYSLYAHHGFLEEQIATLYIVGFSSSMLSGPFLGGLADRYGRKRLCHYFCLLYSLSCLLTLSDSFFLLLLGRVTGGMATSLLFSTFESWMIAEHNRQGFPSDWMSQTFSVATFSNGVAACVAGVLANGAAECCGSHDPVRPFVIAIVFLLLGDVAILKYWNENTAEGLPEEASKGECLNSLRPILRTPKIAFLGAVQFTFEASMYIFVFLWTPMLDPHDSAEMEHPPLGFIFGSFMLAIMCGSSLFNMLLARDWTVAAILSVTLLAAAGSFALTTLASDRSMLLCSFIAFEICCGIFFPAMGTLRGEIIPEKHRAGIMNWFRVPLNIIVVVVLLLVGSVQREILLAGCALLCGFAAVCQRGLTRAVAAEASAKQETEKKAASMETLVAQRDISPMVEAGLNGSDSEA